MSVITFDNFSAGLDLRKGASVSDANRLRVLDNCYVTTGKTIRKRPGMVKIADLEPGTKGLRAANGKLNTFYATGTISHADTQFKANKITHPTLPEMEVQKIHYADSFNGFLYVSAQYNNGDIRHHYLDDVSTLTAWAASTALALSAVRRPVTSNGYRYEVTTAGTTAATEPTWPTTIGASITESGYAAWSANTARTQDVAYAPTVGTGFIYKCTTTGFSGGTEPTWPTTEGGTVTESDSAVTTWTASTALSLGALRRPTVANGFVYEVTTPGTTGGTAPTWPTTVGATVTNGTVTFTCRALASYIAVRAVQYVCRGSEIVDANCPHSAAVVKKSSKIFSVKDDVVRFCKTNDPRNWTESSNAGFLGVGVQQSGAINPTALGEYAGNLVVFFSDSAQVWVVDPDPANMKFVQGVDVGCPFPYGAANMAGDVFFTSYDGVRSITTQSTTGNLIDVDVGSPIDSVLKPILTPSASVRSFYFRGGGQFWAMIGSSAYVYSFSRSSKISAWSRYVFPFPITDVTEMNGDLFFRSGDTVYRFDESASDDAGVVFDVTIEFAYLDFQAPGVLKMITGMDSVMVGEAEIAHRFDARNASLITPGVTLLGDTRPGELTPVEVCTVGIAPVLTCRNSLPFELHALTYLFESLGSMS